MGLWLCLYHIALLLVISIHRALVISSDLLIRLNINNIVPSPIHGICVHNARAKRARGSTVMSQEHNQHTRVKGAARAEIPYQCPMVVHKRFSPVLLTKQMHLFTFTVHGVPPCPAQSRACWY